MKQKGRDLLHLNIINHFGNRMGLFMLIRQIILSPFTDTRDNYKKIEYHYYYLIKIYYNNVL